MINVIFRRVIFNPQTAGTYYIACWAHGIGMGGEIKVYNSRKNQYNITDQVVYKIVIPVMYII